eukprot:scaffold130677_cov90-Phaeocystis_antarctica.AAC.2
MTRQESLRKEGIGQEQLVVVAILLPGCAKGLVAVVALVPKPSEALEGLATGLDDHDARLYGAPSTRLPNGDVVALCVTEVPRGVTNRQRVWVEVEDRLESGHVKQPQFEETVWNRGIVHAPRTQCLCHRRVRHRGGLCLQTKCFARRRAERIVKVCRPSDPREVVHDHTMALIDSDDVRWREQIHQRTQLIGSARRSLRGRVDHRANADKAPRTAVHWRFCPSPLGLSLPFILRQPTALCWSRFRRAFECSLGVIGFLLLRLASLLLLARVRALCKRVRPAVSRRRRACPLPCAANIAAVLPAIVGSPTPRAVRPLAAKARDPGRNIWSPTLELLALLNGGQPSRSAAVLLYGLYTIGAPREREEGCKTGKRAGSDKVTIPVFVQYNTILFCSFPAGSDITLSGHLKDTGHAPG